MIFADPTNDLAFKKVFGDENHKEILISFLNSILGFREGKKITEVSLANPYQIPKIPDLKETILDIKAVNKNGDSFIVEMQKKDLGDFTKRSLYYTSKAYVAQLPKGNDYRVLKKVYFIGILNFNVFDNENYISRHLIINQETNTQDLDDFEFSFIELPKFDRSLSELDTTLDKWIYFLKNASNLSIVPEEFQQIETFKNAFEIVTQTAWDKKELEVYDYMALKEFDEINALRTAEKKGIKQGLEQGKKAEKLLMAKIAKQEGVPVAMISKLTGLNKDEILALV